VPYFDLLDGLIAVDVSCSSYASTCFYMVSSSLANKSKFQMTDAKLDDAPAQRHKYIVMSYWETLNLVELFGYTKPLHFSYAGVEL